MQRQFVLLSALAIWSIIQTVNGLRLQTASGSCVAGISGQPGIQMEFASAGPQVSCLLGQARMEPGDMNRQIMREQQYLDFVFIPIYWAFFFLGIGSPFRKSAAAAGRSLGRWLQIFISIAAVADYLEDAAIFYALDPTYHGLIWPFPFGFAKWLFFFLALTCSGLLFLRYPQLGSFTGKPVRWIPLVRWLAGLPFLFGGLLGVVATISTIVAKGYLLLVAELLMALGLLSLLVWFRKGEQPQTSYRSAIA